MGNGRQETVRIRGKVDARELGLEIQDSANKGRILMGESVVLLARPCGGFKVVERTTRLAPACLRGLGGIIVSNKPTSTENAGLTILENLEY